MTAREASPYDGPMEPAQRIDQRLRWLYGEEVGARTARRLLERLSPLTVSEPLLDPRQRRLPFDQRDVVLITYGDSLLFDGEPTLATLRRFAVERLKGTISTIHLLPFFPFSSDDGFSVTDFHAVNPRLGEWSDVQRLGQDFRLTFDFVLNHVSRQSDWFGRYLARDPAFAELALEVNPGADLSAVVRPRALPLLTPVRRPDGTQVHLWTTFSADQIDLNFRSPEVLLTMVEVMLHYVRCGAEMLRLDAVGFLYKELGTSCMHLPPTHEVIRLLRDVLDLVAPRVALLTETNVPHAQNVSYFSDGYDEAQLVYNFSLPPLLLHALTTSSTTDLTRWARTLSVPSPATTFFNFTASHDGIGVRPLEGLLRPEAIEALAELCQRRGGRVSYREMAGRQVPYELNVTYLDALRGSDAEPGDRHQVQRFLASQAMALALPGVPAIYVGSLLGSRNWQEGVQQTGAPRTINRRRLSLSQVEAELARAGSPAARVFDGLCRLIRVRTAQPAFDPGAAMELLELDPRCFAIRRTCRRQTLLALCNVSRDRFEVDLPGGAWVDALGGDGSSCQCVRLEPYQAAWLTEVER